MTIDRTKAQSGSTLSTVAETGGLNFHHCTHPDPHKPAANLDYFYVIAVISNPVRYKRRYELYWTFKEMCEAAGVKLITVEQAFGDRPFMLTVPNNVFHVQVRTREELWHKENMINIGIRHATAHFDCRQVAWVDADCRPARHPRDWFEETWHQLQHYDFVQMWETMLDLDLATNALGAPMPSFAANYVKFGTPNPLQVAKHKQIYPTGPKAFGRPGLAWAANVKAINNVGGLLDCCILGAGDWYMAHSLIGSLQTCIHGEATSSSGYVRKMMIWQDRAERWIRRNIGYVPGMVYHDFHGRKVNRQYGTRGQILIEAQYDPETDIKYDSQGLLQLETWEPRQIRLRDRIREYFRARNEDSTC